MDFIIRKAVPEDFKKTVDFYHCLIDSMKNAEYRPLWEKDVYPTREFIHDSIEKNELFVMTDNDLIIGSVVLNHHCEAGYSKVQWKVSAAASEIMIVHILAVSADYQGKGLAKKMVEYSIEYGKSRGMKAIRLDVLPANIPAKNLYTRMGFIYMDTIQLFYEDTGLIDFLLYEYPLQEE